MIAGLPTWFFIGVIGGLAEGPMGIFPVRLHVLLNVAWLIELPLAAAAGAWMYKEA